MLVSKLKKILCVGLSAATVLAFTACKQSKPASTGGSSQKPVTLTWYLFVDSVMPDQNKVFAAISDYAQKKINATINVQGMLYADYATKMPVIISSGQDYDICHASTYTGDVYYQKDVGVGAFYKLTQKDLEQYAPNSWKQLPQALWNSGKIKGNMYGFPTYKEEGTQYGFMFNVDLAKQYNLDYSNVKSVKDMGPLLASLHKQAPDLICLNSKSVWNLANPSIPTGTIGEVIYPNDKTFSGQKNNTVFDQYETQEFKDFCTMMHEWYKAGYFPSNPQTYTNTSSDIKSNHLLAFETGYTPDYEKSYSAKVGHTITFLPTMQPMYTGATEFQVISANSKNPTRAMQFLDLVNTDVNMGNLLRHGIEGVNYTMNSNKTVHPLNNGQGYEVDFGWQYGNVFNQNWVESYPSDIVDAYNKFNKSCVSNPLVGYTFDDTNYANQISALSNVVNQYLKPLTTGVMDPATGIPAFVSALKQNGVNDLIQAEQKQVNTFISQNKSSSK